jgi:predicted secreted protein
MCHPDERRANNYGVCQNSNIRKESNYRHEGSTLYFLEEKSLLKT